jgi:hypothetical protein
VKEEVSVDHEKNVHQRLHHDVQSLSERWGHRDDNLENSHYNTNVALKTCNRLVGRRKKECDPLKEDTNLQNNPLNLLKNTSQHLRKEGGSGK